MLFYQSSIKLCLLYTVHNSMTSTVLASCPWGPVTANGVDLLTEIYHHTKIHFRRSIGCGKKGGDTRKEGRKEGRKARKYIYRWIFYNYLWSQMWTPLSIKRWLCNTSSCTYWQSSCLFPYTYRTFLQWNTGFSTFEGWISCHIWITV